MSAIETFKKTVYPNTIDDFKSTISRHAGLARPDRFIIIMRPPTLSLFNLDLQDLAIRALGGDAESIGLRSFVNDPRDIAMLCESTSIPGRQFQSIDYSLTKNPHKVPTGYFNEDVICNFLLTNDYYIKKIFDSWNKAVIDRDFYHLRYDSAFKSDIIIQQLNGENLPIYSVRLKNAWPVSVNSIELNNATSDIERLAVTLTFEDFIEEPPISSTISAIASTVGGLLTKLV